MAGLARDTDTIELVVLVALVTFWYQRSLASAAERFDREPEKIESRWAELGYPVGTSQKVQELLAGWGKIGVERYYVQGLEATDIQAMEDTFAALGG